MSRRKSWVLLLCLGFLLLVVGAIVVTWNVAQYRSTERNAFRKSCRRQVVVFEEFAEQWIVRDQLDSLEGAAMLLLMGSGLYVDVVVQGQIVYSDHDEGLDIELLPEAVEFDALLTEVTIEDLLHGAVEVRSPIPLAGYEGSSIGIIRIGFSGEYTNSQIRYHALRTAGTSLGAWLVVMMGFTVALWAIRRNHPSDLTDDSILQCGTLRIDMQSCEVLLNGQAIELTPKLYELALLFVRQPGVILTDQDILNAIWDGSTYATSADVKQCVYMLRGKLGAAHSDPKRIIVNVKGFGYRLDPPTNEDGLSTD